jgi:hypothetical protein
VVSLVFLVDCRRVSTVWYLLFSVRLYNCSESVISLVFLLEFGTVRQCGISCFLLDCGTVPIVWYLLFSVRFCTCSDSVVFLVFLLDLGTVPIVWYLLCFC